MYTGASTEDSKDFSQENYGFLGDAIEEAGDYDLGPLDLIAVWSKACDYWPRGMTSGFSKYDFTAIISAAYAIQGMPELRGFSRTYLETFDIPEELKTNEPALMHISERLKHVRRSFQEVRNFYSASEGELNLVLSEMIENYSNGFGGIDIDITDAIEMLKTD
jgi:hypothetical protein